MQHHGRYLIRETFCTICNSCWVVFGFPSKFGPFSAFFLGEGSSCQRAAVRCGGVCPHACMFPHADEMRFFVPTRLSSHLWVKYLHVRRSGACLRVVAIFAYAPVDKVPTRTQVWCLIAYASLVPTDLWVKCLHVSKSGAYTYACLVPDT